MDSKFLKHTENSLWTCKENFLGLLTFEVQQKGKDTIEKVKMTAQEFFEFTVEGGYPQVMANLLLNSIPFKFQMQRGNMYIVEEK